MDASGCGSVWSTPEVHKHHEQQNVCHTRPKYREGRRLKAVKVYTINLESRFLLVQGVPAIGLMAELIQLFALYGAIEEYRVLDEYPAEQFTEVYLIKFQKIQCARVAKRNIDERSFFGGLLHVCYAPEYETEADTRLKLQDRKRYVTRSIQNEVKELNENEDGKKPPKSVPCEKQKTMDTGDESQSGDSNIFLGYPSLPLPPQEYVYRLPPSSEQSPLEDNMGSTYDLADTSTRTTRFECHRSSSQGEALQINRRRTDNPQTARFIPRTTHLQNRKRKMEIKRETLFGITDKDDPLVGPRLPESPKLDMEDDSLNKTANLIRSTMTKISSVPEYKPTEKKTTTPKPRRRI